MSQHGPHSPSRGRRRSLGLIALAALTTLLLAAFIIVIIDGGPSRFTDLAAKAPVVGDQCPSSRLPSTTVNVTVAPEIQRTVTAALAPLAKQTLGNRECVAVRIQQQEPIVTVQSAQILPLDRAPDLWIPDSSLWTTRVPTWPTRPNGSFATSPVVVATSQAALDQLGWDKKPPSWAAAMAGAKPVAVPRIAEDAAGLSAVIALWQSLGKGEKAQQALAAAVLATGRAGVPTEQEAIAAAEADSAAAPLLPTSGQAVIAANQTTTGSDLVAIQPTGGLPSLDYPVLTTIKPASAAANASPGSAPTSSPAARERAVKAVVAELASSRSAGLIRAAGFQGGNIGEATPAPAGSASASPSAAASPAAQAAQTKELAGLVQRVALLSAPSRMLVMFDLSGSMAAPAGNGQKRIEFARTSAVLAGNLLTDSAQVGLWGFARDIRGQADLIKFRAVAPLGQKDRGKSHRSRVNNSMRAAINELGGNGTALYRAAVAGMKEMEDLYDPRAGNAVVLFTDGENIDPGGPSLRQTIRQLDRIYNPQKPVRLVCIGIGTGANMKELRLLSSKAGGQAYAAKDPRQLPQVLFEAMNRRDS